ncbi:MAG: N-acetylmuramoyl-L-alanine amidase [Actinomycetota bacterium]|nr:N-acetylmuramoyl-L-alanine amidase [Actinomycetota bacterium]
MRRLLVAVLLAAVLLPPQVAERRLAPEPAAARRPAIVDDHIPYGAKRKRQMARYSGRHYGLRRWKLRNPSVVVLHFTATSTYPPVRNHFASNSPARGEMPGVCTHYVVDKDGTIYELVRLRIRCRHTIGLNHRSIGVEMVQETGRGSHWADRQILGHRKQVRAALRLVRWLRAREGIALRDVIGHAMGNGHRQFEDRQGWRNDHTDWLWRDVKVFRKRLRRIS